MSYRDRFATRIGSLFHDVGSSFPYLPNPRCVLRDTASGRPRPIGGVRRLSGGGRRTAACALLPGTWLLGGLGLSLMALAWLLMAARMTLAPVGPGVLLVVAGFSALAGAHLACRRGTARWHHCARDLSEFAGLFAAVALGGAIATYPIAASNHGFVDARLEEIDRLLRFDWVGWYRIVAAHPLLQGVSRAAYQSIFVTPVVLLSFMAFTRRRAEARYLIVSFWLAAMMTLLLFTVMPAEGPLAFLWHRPIPYMPVSALYQAQLIPELRDHAIRSIDPNALRGLVSAPSFHAASAILYIAAAWRCGPLRWPLVAMNGAMLIATPVEGTHYLTDIIAGIVVALAAIKATQALGAWSELRQMAAPARERASASLA